MNRAYLGLGTNIGDRLGYLKQACDILRESNNINIIKESKIYETKAWGYKNQDDFLNMCVEIQTNLSPEDLLNFCQGIEEKLNRKRIIRWGPRTIDVDILFFNDLQLKSEKLLIPHPRITERAFVLIPLMDLNKELAIKDKSIKEHLSLLTNEEKQEVKEYLGYDKQPI